MRRLTTALAALGLTLLAACGSGASSGATAGGSSATAGSGAAAASAFPVSIENAFGTTTIPSAPQRVVVVGYTEIDTVAALGVTPVAYEEFSTDVPNGIGPWTSATLSSTPTKLTGELNVEQVLALNPDLVIGINNALTADTYAKLSARVPTLARPKEYADYTVPNDVMVTMVGKALGKSTEAAKLLSDQTALLAKYKADNPQFAGKTLTVAWPRAEGKGWYTYTSKDVSQSTMAALGFQLPKAVAALDQSTFYVEVSKERTADLDADVLVLVDPEKQKATVEADPLFQNLTAVKSKHSFWLDGDVFAAFRFASVTSVPYALEKIVPQLQTVLPKS